MNYEMKVLQKYFKQSRELLVLPCCWHQLKLNEFLHRTTESPLSPLPSVKRNTNLNVINFWCFSSRW